MIQYLSVFKTKKKNMFCLFVNFCPYIAKQNQDIFLYIKPVYMPSYLTRIIKSIIGKDENTYK